MGCFVNAINWLEGKKMSSILHPEGNCSMNFTSHHFNPINVSRVSGTLRTLCIVSKSHMMYESYLYLLFTPEANVRLFGPKRVLWKFSGDHLSSPVLIYEEKGCLLGWARWEEGETCFVCRPHCCDCSLISAVSRQRQSMRVQWPTPSESVVSRDPRTCMPISQCIFFFFLNEQYLHHQKGNSDSGRFCSPPAFPFKEKINNRNTSKTQVVPKKITCMSWSRVTSTLWINTLKLKQVGFNACGTNVTWRCVSDFLKSRWSEMRR